MPLIIPANSITGGYEVDNSLRFNDDDAPVLERIPSTSSNQKTFTYSFWVKRANISTAGDLGLVGARVDGNLNFHIVFENSNQITSKIEIGGTSTNLITTALYRDPSAWYHIVFAVDTTQATASNRVKLYVNGEQVTSFSTETYPALNGDTSVNNGTQYVGAITTASNLDGYMAEVCLIDGQQLTPTSFGEFDEDTGIWKPKAVSGLTFGTNGFYLDFESSGTTASLGLDQSGNGNDFTVYNLNTIDQTTDTPTNNFCTMNSLIPNATYSDGNLTGAFNTNSCTAGTLGAGSGKWYFETKITTVANTYIGICSDRNTGTDFDSYRPLTEGIGVNVLGDMYNSAGHTGLDGLPGIANGDIIGCAFDVDNGKLWWSKNGQWYTADAASETTLTIADIEAGNNGYDFSSWTGQFILPYHGTSSVTNDISANFGSPTFTISSGNSDADGYGNFEYAVPSGYYALNTKNLAEYG